MFQSWASVSLCGISNRPKCVTNQNVWCCIVFRETDHFYLFNSGNLSWPTLCILIGFYRWTPTALGVRARFLYKGEKAVFWPPSLVALNMCIGSGWIFQPAPARLHIPYYYTKLLQFVCNLLNLHPAILCRGQFLINNITSWYTKCALISVVKLKIKSIT